MLGVLAGWDWFAAVGGVRVHPNSMNRFQRKAAERYLAKENLKYPEVLRIIPESEWPAANPGNLWQVWRSHGFLVQLYASSWGGPLRMSVNRTALIKGGAWSDQISWEELQRLKRECGYGDYDAVEVYPADRDVVNVANMRHLWILEKPLQFAWRNTVSAS